MFSQLPVAGEAFWFSAMLGRPRHYLSPPLSPVSTSTAWSTTEKGRDYRSCVCLSVTFTDRRWDPARKATVVTARGGQGEEELLSELCYFPNVSPFLPGSQPFTISFQGTAPGEQSAPKGHLSDEYSLPQPMGQWRRGLSMSQSHAVYADPQTILLGTGKSQIPDSCKN